MIDSLLVSRHIAEYLSTLMPDLPGKLEQIYSEARANRVPVIRREAQLLLRFLCLDKEPKSVLEIGTAVGFSSCFMAEYIPADASIFTIEKDDARYKEALGNVLEYRKDYAERRGLEAPSIQCELSDAEAYLTALTESHRQFDLIFLDAAKAQYPVYLSLIRSLMHKSSILITDNVMQEGSVAESKFTVTRRDRTIHLRMREFTDRLFHSGEFDSVMLPLGDGMTVSRLAGSKEKRDEEA